jgi:serine/threonine protein kinase
VPNLPQSVRDRIIKISTSLVQLDLPNVLKVKQVTACGDTVLVVYKFLEGEALENYKKMNKVSSRQLLDWLTRLANALVQVHGNNILHYGFAPDSVFIANDSHPYIRNFGVYSEDSDSVKYPSGAFPPESRTAGMWTEQSDVFSLASLFCGLLAERGLCLKNVYDAKVVPPSYVPSKETIMLKKNSHMHRDLDYILAKSTAISPEERFTGAADFADKLTRFMNGETIVEPEKPSKRFVLTLVIVLAFLAVCVLIWVLMKKQF